MAPENRDPVAGCSPLELDILVIYMRTNLTVSHTLRVLLVRVWPGTGSSTELAGPPGMSPPGLRGGDSPVNCVLAVVPGTLQQPGRRIGQRGDAT